MELADFEETARRCETRGLSSTPSPSTRRPGASIMLGTMVMKIPLLLPLLSLVFRVEPIVRVRLTQM